MNRTRLASGLALALTLASCRIERAPAGRPGGGFAPEPDSVATAEVYAVLRGYYGALTSRDWRLMATHFWPRATLTSVVPEEGDTAGVLRTLTIEEFVAGAGRVRAEVFAAEIANASIVTYGDLADAWVTCRARVGAAAESVVTRHGIDAVHLLRREGRWRIVSLASQGEAPGRPLAPAAPVRR